MTKDEILQAVTQAAAENVVTLAEVSAAYNKGLAPDGGSVVTRKRIGVVELLYYIGGVVVVLGLVVLIAQSWVTFTSLTQLMLTLGVGVVAYLVGVLLGSDKRFIAVGQAFHLIAALVLPIGLAVAFHLGGYPVEQAGVQSVMAGVLFLLYLASFFLWRRAMFLFYAITFGTWWFFALTSLLGRGGLPISNVQYYEYRILLVALAYISFGYSLVAQRYRSLRAWLYGAGAVGFLGAAFALGGFSPEENVFWEAVFPGLVMVFLLLSVYLRVTSFLIFGAVFLVAYVFKITAEYFRHSMGWPLALVLAGFALMAIGYGTWYIKRRYLSVPAGGNAAHV